MRVEPLAPQSIEGGFVLIPARLIMAAWRACRRRPLGIADFRTWLACREMVARRCTLDLDRGRSPGYGLAELSRLTGVCTKRARASVNRLVAAGLLTWSDLVIAFPDAGDPDDDSLADTIGAGKGALTIPRRILRLLADGARPALIATVLACLLRCLARGRGGFKSRGRVKAAWIARTFELDVRRVKHARAELADLGWIVPEPTDQWAMNRWGRAYRIDLGWVPDAPREGPRLPPPPPREGPRLPPPDSHPEPLREEKNQEPAPGGPAGVEIREGKQEEPLPTPPVATTAPPCRADREGEPVCRQPATIPAGAGGKPLPAPTLNDVGVDDLKDTGRLLRLHAHAVSRGLVGASEADRLRFVGAAEHALALGAGNPPGLFLSLVRGRLWRYVTQEDEDRAHARLKRELRGEPPPRPVVGPGALWSAPVLSEDALVVREVRGAMIRAGVYRDPYAAFVRVNPGWTRGRWDRALAELGI